MALHNIGQKPTGTKGGYGGCMFYIAAALILTLVMTQGKAQPPFKGTVLYIDSNDHNWPVIRERPDTVARVYMTHDNKPVLKPCFVVTTGAVVEVYDKRWKPIDRKKIQRIL